MAKGIIAISAFFFLVLFAAFAFAIPVEFTVKAEGAQITIIKNETTVENCTLDEETNLTHCVNQTITKDIKKTEPWQKSMVIGIECAEMCAYPMPSFNPPSDVEIEKYSVDTDAEATVVFESTNLKTTDNPEDKVRVQVAVKQYSELVLDRILPLTVTEGVSQVNVFITNNGTEAVSYFNVSVIGSGITSSTAESFDKIDKVQMAIVPIDLNISGSGQKDIIIKINWKSGNKMYSSIYSSKLTVSPLQPQPQPGEKVNSTELLARFNSDKEKFRQYEMEYSNKKAEGYLVSEIYDSIKNAKEYVATVQLMVEEEKFSDIRGKLVLLELSLEDIETGLKNAQKTKQTFTDKLKSNALLITTLITAIVGIIGLYERQKSKVKAIKEKIAEKKASREEKKSEKGEEKKTSKEENRTEKDKKASEDKKQKPAKKPKKNEKPKEEPEEAYQ